jgi:hypothetical protein
MTCANSFEQKETEETELIWHSVLSVSSCSYFWPILYVTQALGQWFALCLWPEPDYY